MGTGIIICGLNGAGKSTMGKVLARELGFYFIDSEELYFPKTGPHYTYAFSRTRKEVEQLLFSEIKAHKDSVFAPVKGDYGGLSVCFSSMPCWLMFRKIFDCNELKNALFRNLAVECYPVGIYTSRKETSLTLLNPELRIRLKNGTIVKLSCYTSRWNKAY